jgi:cytochrome c553
MKQFTALALLLGAALVFSCTKKAAPAKTDAAKAPAVTYEANIKPLIQAKCTPCHIPADGGRKMALDNPTTVKASSDEILRRVQLNPNIRGFMPFKKDPLTEAEITMLKNWKAAGTP